MLFSFIDPEDCDNDFAFLQAAPQKNLEKTRWRTEKWYEFAGFDAISQLVNKIAKWGTKKVAKQSIFNSKHSGYKI